MPLIKPDVLTHAVMGMALADIMLCKHSRICLSVGDGDGELLDSDVGLLDW